ncbi:hypothetical protein BGX28_004330 [Mortierella sp. GBA30]|nr:hypothetical protein BGX28_004330 [Mortierella sp. GBA30]
MVSQMCKSGLGHIALQWAKAMGCKEIIAISAEMLEFAAKHDVRPWVEKRPYEECNKALKDVHAGKPRYRIVLEMNSSTKASH